MSGEIAQKSVSDARSPDLRVRRFTLLGTAREVLARRETIAYLVNSNLKAGNRDKLLGNLWSLLDPLLFMGVYFLVFGLGLRQAGDDRIGFIIYLTIGIVTFRFTEGCASQAATCLRANQGIIGQVPFPKAILPIVLGASRLHDFVWSLAALCLALPFIGHSLTIYSAWALVLIPIQILFSVGLAYFIAYIGALFADTSNMVTVVMRLLFFMSPIFYFASDAPGHKGIVPPEFLPYYELNPLVGFMDAYRDALLWGQTPELAGLATTSLVVFVAGFAIFARGEGKYAKYV